MHNICLKIIQIEKKITVITCAYIYMKNTIRLSNNTIPFVHKTGIYIILVQQYLFVCTGKEVVEDLRLGDDGVTYHPVHPQLQLSHALRHKVVLVATCRGQKCIVDDVIHGNQINPKYGLRLCVVLWCHSYSRSSIFIDL